MQAATLIQSQIVCPRCILNALESSFVVQPPRFEEEMLHKYTDAELIQIIRQCPRLVTILEQPIRVLSPGLLAKRAPDLAIDIRDEVAALKVAASIGIRVPTVRRVVLNERDRTHYIIMEHIPGLTLEQLWPSLNWYSTLRVAWQLRKYLQKLRRVTSQTSGGLVSGRTRSVWLEGLFEPMAHASPSAFSGYLNWWLTKCPHEKPLPDLVLDAPKEHILVHGDLCSRNMILDADQRLWLVDWGNSGFYPDYMEYIGIEPDMVWINARTWSAWWHRLRWRFLRLIAAGPAYFYEKGQKVLHEVYNRSSEHERLKPAFSMT